MRTSRTRTLTGAAVAALALLTAACGSSGGSGAAVSPAPSDEKITLTVNLFGDFGYKKAGLYDQFMADHPNITVEETSVEQENDYWKALQPRLASGTGVGDIQGIEVGRIAQVTSQQADLWYSIQDLGGGDLSSQFLEWKWGQATTADGKTLGLGTDTGPMALCYRQDLFKEAGLPTDPAEVGALWTSWDDYNTVGEQYQAKAPKNSHWVDTATNFFNAVISSETSKFSDANGELIYEDSPQVKEAWDLSVKVAQSDITAKMSAWTDDWNKGFSTGTFATISCPAWMQGYIQGQAGDKGKGKWNIAVAPAAGNWGGSYLGIPKGAAHPAEAFELAKFLTSAGAQEKVFTTAGNFPSNTGAVSSAGVTSFVSDYFGPGAEAGKIFGQEATSIPVQTVGPNDGIVQNAISTGLQRIEQQGANPDESWQKVVNDVNKAVG
jgi:cellobiose transport system substrate-binding protein